GDGRGDFSDRREQRVAVRDTERDAAHVGLVRDLGAQHLDRYWISEGQGRRTCDVDLERNRRRACDAETIEQRTGCELVEDRSAACDWRRGAHRQRPWRLPR